MGIGSELKDTRTIPQMVEENLAIEKEAGWKVTWHWNTKGPYGKGIDEAYGQFHFLDHLYMLKKDGRTIYCSEPYGLDSEDIVELARLIEEGWQVSIGQAPLWYPGRTTQILIRRDK